MFTSTELFIRGTELTVITKVFYLKKQCSLSTNPKRLTYIYAFLYQNLLLYSYHLYTL